MSLQRIVLVGTQGTHRLEIARAVKVLLPDADIVEYRNKDLRGSLTDYRVEIDSALQRAKLMAESDNAIFVDSVLDNLAHVCVNTVDSEGIGEAAGTRLFLTGQLLYAIVYDTFQADKVFYLPYDGPETEDKYIETLDNLYPSLLEEFGIEFITVEGTVKERMLQIKQIIEAAHDSDDSTAQDREGTVSLSSSSSEDATG